MSPNGWAQQRIIAVQLSGGLPPFDLPTGPAIVLERLTRPPCHFTVLSRVLAVLLAQADLRRIQHPPALLLRPDVTQIGTLDMTRSEEGRRALTAVARATADSLLALRTWRLEDPAPALPMHERLQTVSA